MNIKIGKNITKLRREHNVTQAQLADYLSISPQAVSKWEQEVGMPDVYLIPKIAFFFNVTIDGLFGVSDLDTTTLLVSKYEAVGDERSYREAKDAVEALLAVDSHDVKALGLLTKVEHYRGIEFIKKSQEVCEKLLEAAKNDPGWTKRARVQLMDHRSILGDYGFIDECREAFAATGSAEDLNFLLIALGRKHLYEESLELGNRYIGRFSKSDQMTIYPSLLEAACVLEQLNDAQECFDEIVKGNDIPQVFNAWWVLWKLHDKLGNVEEAGRHRDMLLTLLPDQGYNQYTYERIESHLRGSGQKPLNVL